MRSFWRGLVWGGIAGSMIGAMVTPLLNRHRKPLIERGVDMLRDSVMDKTNDWVKEARRTRKRLLRNFR